MASDDLARLRAMVEAASPAPWTAHNFRSYPQESWSVVCPGDEPPVCDDACSEADARAIAALRNAAPELLAVAEAAEGPASRCTALRSDTTRCGACAGCRLHARVLALRAKLREVLP